MRKRWGIPGVAALLAAAVLAPGPAHASPLDATARLQGQFDLTGRITVARHVPGERVGQPVQRTWAFTPLCPAGPCTTVALTRQRQAGTDRLVLTLQAADYYVGHGRFYAPVRCGARRFPRGVSVPFTVTVRITGTALAGSTLVATQVHATYANRERTSRVRCVIVPGHDAAVYDGALAPAA